MFVGTQLLVNVLDIFSQGKVLLLKVKINCVKINFMKMYS